MNLLIVLLLLFSSHFFKMENRFCQIKIKVDKSKLLTATDQKNMISSVTFNFYTNYFINTISSVITPLL